MHSSLHYILKPLNSASLLHWRQLSNSPDFSSLFSSSQSSLTSAGEHNNAFHRNRDLHSNPLLEGEKKNLSQDIRSGDIHMCNIKELHYCLLILHFQLLYVANAVETKNRFCATSIHFSDLNFVWR